MNAKGAVGLSLVTMIAIALGLIVIVVIVRNIISKPAG